MAAPLPVLLVQLPIPPAGPERVRGNVPLAAGYLKLHAQRTRADAGFRIEILEGSIVDRLGDRALVDEIVARRPALLGFTLYVWNVDRTLWIARRVRERLGDRVRIVVGGPEVTLDNAWLLGEEGAAVDLFAFGEGEQTFSELLRFVARGGDPRVDDPGIDGLGRRAADGVVHPPRRARTPLERIDAISSPYLDGILDAGDSESLLLETSRGCVFKCKFCYYPKAYDRQYFLAPELVTKNLEHARSRGARDVFLLDPTLNQRPDFLALVDLLAEANPDRSLRFHAELRGEGLTPKVAAAMARANFHEVEIGLQSTDPHTQELMDRRNNLRAFENGVRALRDVGIRVKVDLIVGLPGDTEDSVRRGMHWVAERDLVDDVQVFHLGILPGTAFRAEAAQLGLRHQDHPPYSVLGTRTLDVDAMRGLVAEAEEIFDTSFDPLPPPWFGDADGLAEERMLDLDARADEAASAPSATSVASLRLRTSDPLAHLPRIESLLRTRLAHDPFAVLHTALELPPGSDPFPIDVLDRLRAVLHEREERIYLDRYHEWTPGSPVASRRLSVVLPAADRDAFDGDWLEAACENAEIVWRSVDGVVDPLVPGREFGEWEDRPVTADA